MKRIVFEWRTRMVDFSTRDEALKYVKYMRDKNYINPSYEIYENGEEKLPYTLRIEYINKNSRVGGGW